MRSGSEIRQRSESVRLRLTREEYAMIGKRAEECGMTVSAFLRATAMGRRTRHITTSRIIDALVRLGNEQRRIGGLIKHLRSENVLTASERAALPYQIEVAQQELRRYLVRRLAAPLDTTPSSPLLCNLHHGLRGYTGAGLRRGITELLHEAGIRDVDGRVPRIQDFRHSFAIESLMRWYRQGADVQSNLPKLALYMGHVSIVSTAYYLRWTPELQELASNRFAKRFGYLVRGEQ
jgi:hypothetical protein